MITLERVSLSVAGKTILDEVTFQVGCGETVAVVGESGGGKTSLARLLLGLLDGRASERCRRGSTAGFHWSGSARVGGLDVLTATPRQMRAYRGRRAGLIVQALSDALNPHLTVLQHMEEVLKVQHVAGIDARAACLDHNIPADLHHRLPAGLSGGEIQRVLTALALVGDPPYLILDEPTASLDPANKDRAVAAFMKGRESRCQLLITHDLDLARRLADRTGVLHQGRLVEIGPTEDVFERPNHDYTRSLLQFAVDAAAARMRQPKPLEDAKAPTAPAVPERAARRAGLLVSNVSHGYGGRPVLRGVSVFVPAGTCLAILGESGCGKSTLARLLTGFEPLQSGTIEWCPAAGPAAFSLSALVSQHPHRALARHFNVEQVLREAVLLSGRRHRGTRARRSDIDRRQIESMLSRVGLPVDDGFLTRKTAALSGGEAQRLVIARALATNPRYLIADEPTSALDMSARAQILSLLRELTEESGLALVLFTHDPAAARTLADRCLHLRNGELSERVSEGPERIGSPASIVFEEVPQTAG
ncbi:peptide/nickel transport system ATP-binding protein [Rhodobium orientis]|uniref:ABC transporter domain-containing protein n=1 Tax=Rhodobium orientis TaxID=34017 RepID=A0A327JNK1_9HYPH|nr:ATP-binding cassette domain-containing protein [Rhodobium orientis]MBB4303192.1 peptide/nickel transport system ATP-binding protein [Rhodobium orientis]MBK5951707.1 hypothetical protein [Rhodobium orientis]RAI24998.1 hypothetical protein CH339_20190 [Rhodobium orientis]